MSNTQMNRVTFYASIIITLILSALAVMIARPFFGAIVFGVVFAYWLYPLHSKLASKLKPTGSALLLTALVLIVISVIFQYGAYLILKEMSHLLATVESIDILSLTGAETAGTWISTSKLLQQISDNVYRSISDFVQTIPYLLISLFVFLTVLFYSLRDGEKVFKWIEKKAPFPSGEKKRIFSGIKGYTNAFIKVQVLIGILQGVVCAIAFYLFGLREYILLASLAAAILSIIPVIGPYLIYLPVGSVMALQGNFNNGIGLIFFGLIIGSLLDYIIRPQLTGKYAKIHPLIVLLGILGGVVAFGVIGIIIGPVILSIFLIILKELRLSTTKT